MGKPDFLPNFNSKALEVGAPGLIGLDPGNTVPDVARKPVDEAPEDDGSAVDIPVVPPVVNFAPLPEDGEDGDMLADIPQIPVENFAPLPDDSEGMTLLEMLLDEIL